jgi:hypothetical protein
MSETVVSDGEVLRAMVKGGIFHPSRRHSASDTFALLENADISDPGEDSRQCHSGHSSADDPNSLKSYHWLLQFGSSGATWCWLGHVLL